MDVDPVDSSRPAPHRSSSKRALSASPSLEDAPRLNSLTDLASDSNGKRIRSNSTCPPRLAAALSLHQATFDAHTAPPIGWSDLSKRQARIQADISLHPVRVREWSSAALAELQASREVEDDIEARMRHIDACTRLANAALEGRRVAREALRDQLGAPWSTEEETYWTMLNALDTAEDGVCDVVLSLALHGFSSVD